MRSKDLNYIELGHISELNILEHLFANTLMFHNFWLPNYLTWFMSYFHTKLSNLYRNFTPKQVAMKFFGRNLTHFRLKFVGNCLSDEKLHY